MLYMSAAKEGEIKLLSDKVLGALEDEGIFWCAMKNSRERGTRQERMTSFCRRGALRFAEGGLPCDSGQCGTHHVRLEDISHEKSYDDGSC